MATLLMFAAARDAAGTGRADIDAATVGEVLARAEVEYGEDFTAVLKSCRVWVNGEPADATTAVRAGDEVAILPPVSGGFA
jgi:MoaD family protein